MTHEFMNYTEDEKKEFLARADQFLRKLNRGRLEDRELNDSKVEDRVLEEGDWAWNTSFNTVNLIDEYTAECIARKEFENLVLLPNLNDVLNDPEWPSNYYLKRSGPSNKSWAVHNISYNQYHNKRIVAGSSCGPLMSVIRAIQNCNWTCDHFTDPKPKKPNSPLTRDVCPEQCCGINFQGVHVCLNHWLKVVDQEGPIS